MQRDPHIPVPQRKSRFTHWPKLVLLVTLIVSASCTWLLTSNAGLQLLVSALARSSSAKLEYHGLQGRLIGPIQLQSLSLRSGETQVTITDLRLDWYPSSLLHGRLELNDVRAGTVAVVTPSSNSDVPMPQDLSLPISLALTGLHVDSLHLSILGDSAPYFSAHDMDATLSSDGKQFEVHDLQGRSDFGQLRASGVMQATRPYLLQAQAELASINELADIDSKAHIYAIANGDLSSFDIAARGEGAGLDGTAQVRIAPLSVVPLRSLDLQVSGLNPQAFAPTAPKARLKLRAALRGSSTQLLAGKIQLHNDSPATLDLGGLPVVDVSAQLGVSATALRCDELLLKLQGAATITGNFTLQRNNGVADLRVIGLDPSALDSRLRGAHLNGSLKLSGNAKEQHGKLDLSDATQQLTAELVRRGDKLTLQNLRIARGTTELIGTGEFDLGKLQPYSFNGQLHHFDLATFMPHAPRSDLNATLALSGAFKPQASGKLDFQMSGSRLAEHAVSGNGQIEFSSAKRGKGEVVFTLGDNHLSLTGGVGDATDRLQLDISAPALAQLGAGFGGALNLHASLAGDLTRPDATLAAEAHDLSIPDAYQLADLSAAASLHGDALSVSLHANELRNMTRNLLRSLQVDVRGSIAQHDIQAQVQMEGDNKLQLRAQGGLDTKDIGKTHWQGVLSELSTTGVLPVKLMKAAPVSISRERISLGATEFALAGGRFSIASVDWTPWHWSSRGDFTGIGLRMGLALQPDTGAPDDLQTLRLGGEWDINSATQLTGQLDIHRERGDLILAGTPPTPLGLSTLQFSAHAAAGKIAAELSVVGTLLGEWNAQISAPQSPAGAGWPLLPTSPLSGHAHISADNLDWIGAALDGDIKTGGRLTLDADLAGTLAAPRLIGQLKGESLLVALLDQGIRLEQGRLSATFDRQSVHIDELVFIAPHDAQPRDSLLSGVSIASTPGALHATGNINLDGSDSDLEISAFQLPLAQRKDRWIIASGNGHARLNQGTLYLSGNVTTDAGLIRQVVSNKPQLSDDVVIIGRQVTARQGPRISVDASLDMGDHFYLRVSGLEARLAGKLNVRESPGNALRVTGAISARDAIFEAYGQNLTVERGIVNFAGPIYDPSLNILAVRKGLSVEAGVTVTGTALHPVVQLVSTPTVPDTEKLSWIVLGRPPDATGTDISLLLAAAESVVGSGSTGVTGQLKQSLGIDQLSLRSATNATTAQGTPAANADPLSNQIAVVGKRLSARAFLSYEQGVTAAAGVTKLTYTLTPRINIITQAGFENAIDVTYSFSFE